MLLFRIFIILLCSALSPVNADEVTIAFKEVKIASVLESVAEVTGKTFIKDPRVQGKMTIIASEPLDSKHLFEVFLSALQVHGFQAVKDGQIYRVLPLSQSYRVPTNGAGGTLTTELVQLKYGNAKDVISILRPMISQGAILQAHNPSNTLIINDTMAQIQRIKRILKDIDTPPEDDLTVLQLNYVAVAEVVKIAKDLKLLNNTQLEISHDVNDNRLLLSGPMLSRKRVIALAKKLDTLETQAIVVDVIYLHYIDAKDIKPILDGMLSSGVLTDDGGDSKGKKTYSIQEDVANNAIVIAGKADLIARIRLLVDKLDKPRLQVLIEAVIAEVTQDQARVLGAQLAAGNGGLGGIVDFNGAVAALGGAIAVDDGIGTTVAVAAASALASQGLSLAGGAVLGNNSIGLLVNALQTNARSNILSTPSILTLDNEEATISVGQEVPFLTGSYTNSANGSSNPFQTIQREEVGISLKVTPQINEGDAVRLKIEQESSNLVASASANDILQQSTAKRTISTNVMVYDGQLLVLGGLMNQSDTISRSKVPILGDIPLLGRLFRSTRKTKVDNVLMVFIRPTIIRTKGEAGEVSSRKYRTLREKQAANIDFGNLKVESVEAAFQKYRNQKLIDSSPTATVDTNTATATVTSTTTIKVQK